MTAPKIPSVQPSHLPPPTPTTTSPTLQNYTPARVSLRRTGVSLATSEVLDFQLAHAEARDAVKAELDPASFSHRLRTEVPTLTAPILTLASAAADRTTYLRRPDRGRTLTPDSASLLKPSPCDIVIIIADGLSATAVEHHAIPVLIELLPILTAGQLHPWPHLHRQPRPRRHRRRDRRAPQSSPLPHPHRRTPRPQFPRLPRRLHHLESCARPHRRRTQLHLQHSHRRPGLRHSRQQNRLLLQRSPTPSADRHRSQRNNADTSKKIEKKACARHAGQPHNFGPTDITKRESAKSSVSASRYRSYG